MQKKTIAAPERIIAAVFFTLMALEQLALMIANFTAPTLFLFFGFIICAVALYGNMRNPVLLAGIALVILGLVIQFFMGFSQELYSTYSWGSGLHFNLLAVLPYLVRIAAWVVMLLLALTFLMGTGDRSLVRRLWFLPALLLVCAPVVALLVFLLTGGRWVGFEVFLINTLTELALVPTFIFAALWIIEEEPEGYYSIAKHIAMTIFTLGLWYVVWVWHVTRRLNSVDNAERRKPTASLLLCLFLPLYATYWNYTSAQRIDRLAKQNGVESKLDVLCLVLSLVIPFLPSIIMQEKLNRITLVQFGTLLPDFTENKAPEVEPVSEPAGSVQTATYNAALPEL